MAGDLQRLKSMRQTFSSRVTGVLSAAVLLSSQVTAEKATGGEQGERTERKGHTLAFWDYLTLRQGNIGQYKMLDIYLQQYFKPKKKQKPSVLKCCVESQGVILSFIWF